MKLYERMGRKRMVKLCRERGLKVSGRKHELICRLYRDDGNEEAAIGLELEELIKNSSSRSKEEVLKLKQRNGPTPAQLKAIQLASMPLARELGRELVRLSTQSLMARHIKRKKGKKA